MNEQNPWVRPPEDEPVGQPPQPTLPLAAPADGGVSLGKPAPTVPGFAAPDAAAEPLPSELTAPGAQPPPSAAPSGYFAPDAPQPLSYPPPVSYPTPVSYPQPGQSPYPQPVPPSAGPQPYPPMRPIQQAPLYGAPPADYPQAMPGIHGDPGFGASSAAAAAPYTLDAYGMPVPARTDPMAATSLGLGIASLSLSLFTCCCWFIGFVWALMGLVALVLGFAAKRNIDAAPGLRSGRGLAIGGMITGGIGAVVAIGFMVLFGVLGYFSGSPGFGQ